MARKKYSDEQKYWIYNARLRAKEAQRWIHGFNVNVYGKVSAISPTALCARDCARQAASYYFKAFPDQREQI